MKGFRLSKGMFVKWNGHDYKIETRLNEDQLQLKNISTNEFRAISEIELIAAYENRDLVILGQNKEHADLQVKLEHKKAHDFTALDEEFKVEARRRHSYVQQLIKTTEESFSDEFLAKIIAGVGAQIEDKNPPSTRSVRRWYMVYRESGKDIRALVSARKAQGNRTRKFGDNKEQCEIMLITISNAIDEIFLTTQRNPIEAVYNKVEVEINRLNQQRNPADQLHVPAKSSIFEIVAQLDQYEVDKARHGERYADAKHRVYQQNERPTRPLERVECDDTKADLMVIDDESCLPLGRPWLFVLICVYTKMILGYFLSFEPPSYVSVMLCLRHAIKPKSYVRGRYPMINNNWDTYGLIETLVVDNAKHWYSRNFDDACLQLGMSVQYAPVSMPWYKSSVERFFGTLNKKFLHRQPGTTFSNIFDKGDYDPAKHAVITLSELEELLHKWIIDVYSQDEHRGIRNVPARLWKIGVSKYPPALPPSIDELDVLLGKVEYRQISKLGIVRHHLFYNGDLLVTIRNSAKKGSKVKIKYDPMNLGMIHVYDAFHGRWVPVPALDQDYASSLTEWQHKVITRFARQTIKDSIDMVALAEAKEYLRTRVLEIISGKNRQKLKVKAARWLTTADPAEPRLIALDKPKNKQSNQSRQSNKTDSMKSETVDPVVQTEIEIKQFSDTEDNLAESDDDFDYSEELTGGNSDKLDTSGWSSGYNLP